MIGTALLIAAPSGFLSWALASTSVHEGAQVVRQMAGTRLGAG